MYRMNCVRRFPACRLRSDWRASVPGQIPPPATESVDLKQLLQPAVSDAALEAHARRCTLRLEKCVPATIQGNPQLLHSALENVVRNAVKYTSEGTAVTLAMTRDPQRWLEIRVYDHGPGVPE